MSFENIGWILIIAYLGWRLFSAVKKETAPVVHIKKEAMDKSPIQKEVWNDEEFLQGAKLAFHMIASAFAKGKKKELKIMLSPSVYDVFEQDINAREEKKQTMDFSLICVNSAKILKKAEAVKEVTVQFISEQINILKDEQGNAIEGDPMSISVMQDTWTFRKKKNNTWIVCATQSEAVNA